MLLSRRERFMHYKVPQPLSSLATLATDNDDVNMNARESDDGDHSPSSSQLYDSCRTDASSTVSLVSSSTLSMPITTTSTFVSNPCVINYQRTSSAGLHQPSTEPYLTKTEFCPNYEDRDMDWTKSSKISNLKRRIRNVRDEFCTRKTVLNPDKFVRCIDEALYVIDGRGKQLSIALQEILNKNEMLLNYENRISALEKLCEGHQINAKSCLNRVNQLLTERDELSLRNASLKYQIDYERREWSIERERLSLELDDVTRELEIQKMILNGRKFSAMMKSLEGKVLALEEEIADRDTAIRAQQIHISNLTDSLHRKKE